MMSLTHAALLLSAAEHELRACVKQGLENTHMALA